MVQQLYNIINSCHNIHWMMHGHGGEIIYFRKSIIQK
jgi:hypothetical protein